MKQKFLTTFGIFFVFFVMASDTTLFAQNNMDQNWFSQIMLDTKSAEYQEYADFFKKVYEKMQENYYQDVTKDNFLKFMYMFHTRIYNELKISGKSRQYIKWRSAAYLVEALKSPEDIFSAFFPPKDAKRYEQEVLGKRIDLGLEGNLTPEGYSLTRVEIRADAYEKGIREKDLLVKIDQQSVFDLSNEKIQELLMPLENTTVALEYVDHADDKKKKVDVVSKEYFKQLVFMIPVPVPGVYCLKIEHFNRMTGEDMGRFLEQIMREKDTSLILDLRGNPGGPPLAAREISAFFLPPNEEFAYFQLKNKPKAVLDIPEIPEQNRYKGNIVILVNEKSGSASELFSGVMQDRGRATIMGTNTAGQVFLKSMFNFDDDSMALLVTARGHFPDGKVFSFNGITPNEKVEGEAEDMVKYAAEYLLRNQRPPSAGRSASRSP